MLGGSGSIGCDSAAVTCAHFSQARTASPSRPKKEMNEVLPLRGVAQTSYAAERRALDKERRRAEIIDAAEELCRELGWDGVTMDGVARRARLSRALVYLYFKDRRELHCALVFRALAKFRARYAEACARVPCGLQRVEALLNSYLSFAYEFQYYFDVYAKWEAASVDGSQASHLERTCVEASNGLCGELGKELAAGQVNGTIRSDIGDLNMASRIIWSFAHGLVQIAINRSQPLAHASISVPQLTRQAVVFVRNFVASQ